MLVVASYLTTDVTVWVYQSHSDDRSTLLSVPELVMNYELDKVLSVKVCQACLAGLDSCRVGLTMTALGSFVYLGVPVLIYNRIGNI